MTRIITLGSRRQVTIAQYVAAIKLAKANPAFTFAESLRDRWSVKGSVIVQQFYADMVTDHCNRGLAILEDHRSAGYRLLKRIKSGRITRSCKWCGQTFTPLSIGDDFCDTSCRRSYYN